MRHKTTQINVGGLTAFLLMIFIVTGIHHVVTEIRYCSYLKENYSINYPEQCSIMWFQDHRGGVGNG